MTPELLVFLTDRLRIPNATKLGLVISLVIFKGFDIEGRVKRTMRRKTHA